MLCKQNKETKAEKVQIRVFGHEYACAYIGLAYAAQLYAYICFEYACACVRIHTLTLTQKIKDQQHKN